MTNEQKEKIIRFRKQGTAHRGFSSVGFLHFLKGFNFSVVSERNIDKPVSRKGPK